MPCSGVPPRHVVEGGASRPARDTDFLPPCHKKKGRPSTAPHFQTIRSARNCTRHRKKPASSCKSTCKSTCRISSPIRKKVSPKSPHWSPSEERQYARRFG